MSSKKIQELRQIVRDEQASIIDRKVVAEHMMQVLVDSVPEPSDDDPEVLRLRQPWKDRALADIMAKGAGVAVNGETLSDAKEAVFGRKKLRAVLDVIVDEAAHRLEKLAACQRVLGDHPGFHNWGLNGYTPEHLLAVVLPVGSFKWTSTGKHPVQRPPMSLADVW
jgi:hypothetical protein